MWSLTSGRHASFWYSCFHFGNASTARRKELSACVAALGPGELVEVVRMGDVAQKLTLDVIFGPGCMLAWESLEPPGMCAVETGEPGGRGCGLEVNL